MGMTVGGKKASMFEPNIVPLIDVLLVLIIIFMVLTPAMPQGLDARIPQPARPPASQPHEDVQVAAIVVQLTSGGDPLINQDKVSWEGLGPRLQDIFKQRAEKAAFVEGDDSVELADVARAIDTMRGAGIDNVGLITARIQAGQ
jgi:biopolymer transport protein TolR